MNKIVGSKTHGYSMYPLISENDVIYFQKVTAKELRINDILVYYSKKKLICHRLIRKRQDTLVLKGDNLPYFDLPIKDSQIVGKVTKIKSRFGTINLLSVKSHIFQYYFLFFSLCTFYIPQFFYNITKSFFIGRRFILKIIADSIQ